MPVFDSHGYPEAGIRRKPRVRAELVTCCRNNGLVSLDLAAERQFSRSIDRATRATRVTHSSNSPLSRLPTRTERLEALRCCRDYEPVGVLVKPTCCQGLDKRSAGLLLESW